MSRLSNTITLITLYEPNINMPQNLVNSFTPVKSKLIKSTIPKDAQNSVCAVSNKLK